MEQQSHTLFDSSNQQDRALCAELAHACLKNSRYVFVAGGMGGDFFDIDEFSAGREMSSYKDAPSRPIDLANHVARKIRELQNGGIRISRLGFIERDTGPVGMITYKDLIGSVTQLQTFSVRPRKRLLTSAIKGRPIEKGEAIALISDVATTGEAILSAAEKIWEAGGRVSCAIVLYDRGEGAQAYLAQYDVELFSLFDVSCFIQQGHVQESTEHLSNIIQFVGVGMTK